MEIQELKELALIFKETANTKKKTTLDIFYNVENCTEMLGTDTYLRYTPTYTTKTEPALSVRGSIRKNEVSKLKVGLRNVSISSKDIGVHAKWTFSVYNRNTEQYQLISKSRMNISSITKVTKFPVQLSDLQHLIHENTLLFKWNIEILPSPPGQAIVRSPDDINKTLDKLFETLSVDKHDESEKEKTLLSMMEDLGKCKNRQKNNEDKLQTIEQNVLDINDRLTTMLSNTYVTRERCLEERGRQTYHSPQTIPTDQRKRESKIKLTLEEKGDKSPTENTAQYETKTSQKLSCDKETQTESTFLKTVEPRYTGKLFPRSRISPDLSEKSSDLSMFAKDRWLEIEDLERKRNQSRLKEIRILSRQFSSMGSLSPRLKEEEQEEYLRLKRLNMKFELEWMLSSDMLAHKRILFLGCDIELMRAILCQYKNSAFWRMSDKKELQLMQCEDEGIYFYCGCISGSAPESDLLSLMSSSEKYKAHGFHACVIVIRTMLDTQILDIFDDRFLRQFCFLLMSNDLDFMSLGVRDIVRFDWFSFGRELLKNKLERLSTEQFQFDRNILKTSTEQAELKEMNEVKEKCLLFRDFLRTIKNRNIVGHTIQPVTQQIRFLLLECQNILLEIV
ncbi:hypothetical protein Bpfe_020519 [Biomphalaria pfeifferi]|uniref:Uncharacterized protein n=1 Tax=Biomphalaria pfeifferi TaxID=112525 RepID=A0AAD8F455_BIOPF|nr:hypothetical protein Bpfe_020519 [Biomphalaria pfeifferi]